MNANSGLTDVLVIGSGLAGLSAAWQAAKRGCRVGVRPQLTVSFGNTDGGFETYDVSTHQSHEISETEAIALFQGKLCERCGWHFLYIYEAMNQDVQFTVGFNSNGRVVEVGSPGFHGW